MKELYAFKIQEQIKLIKRTLAPTTNQTTYLNKCKKDIQDKLVAEARIKNADVELCLLVALCGELKPNSTEKEQAEFAARLLLLDLLTEQI